MRFKKNKVWMAVDGSGDPMRKDGRVLIKYQQKQDYEYWVNPENISPLDSAGTDKMQPEPDPEPPRPPGNDTGNHPGDDLPSTGVIIYTDGASSGNPGPSGIGIVLQYGRHTKEISRYIGTATNNVAELEAIRTALAQLKKTGIPVRLHTDSNYAVGVLTKRWKARENQDLVRTIRLKMKEFKDLKLIKVKGHSGQEGNVRADRLATLAIASRSDQD